MKMKQMIFRVPPDWVDHVAKIVESRDFPYKTSSHLLRHALHRHLAWLGKVDKGELRES